MLDEKDLKKIGKLLDTKLEVKLDEKLKKELKPLKADIAKIRTDVSTLVGFYDRMKR